MKTTSQFVEPETWRLKIYKNSIRNREPLIVESELWDSLEDPFIDKLVTQMEKNKSVSQLF
jgi:hypothetical protein